MRTILKTIIFLLVLTLIGLAIYIAMYSKEEESVEPISPPVVNGLDGLPIAESQIFTEPVNSGLNPIEEGVTPIENSLVSSLKPNEIDINPIISAIFVAEQPPATTTASGTDPFIIYLGQNINGIFRKNLGLSKAEKIADLETARLKKVVWVEKKDPPRLIAISHDKNTKQSKIISWPEASTTPQLTNVYDVSISPDKKNLFYIEELGGGVIGYMTDLDFKKREKIFSSPFASWKVSWFASTTIAIQSKASNQALGITYFLNTITKKLTKILGKSPAYLRSQVLKERCLLYLNRHLVNLN